MTRDSTWARTSVGDEDRGEGGAGVGVAGRDAGTLGAWMDAHLAARAHGYETFRIGAVVADRRGQFGLFGGDVEA
jgi:hypothetical protein